MSSISSSAASPAVPPSAAEVQALVSGLTQPGAPFELEELEVQGRRVKAYRRAPASLAEVLQQARAHGAKEFMAYEGVRWSYDDFFKAADALAHWMQTEAGLHKGARVAIAMRNRPEWAVAFAAAILVGGVPAPLNSFGLRDELCSAINDLEPALLICDAERFERLSGPGGSASCRTVVLQERAAAATHGGAGAQADFTPWDQAMAHLGSHAQEVWPDPDEAALLLSTSGSTSHPKWVLSTHRSVCQALMNIDFIGAMSAMGSPKIIAALMARGLAPATLTAVPLFHVSGLHAQLLTTLRNGRRLVFMHRWNASQALETIRQERITQFNGAPAMVMQLLEEAGADPASQAPTLAAIGFGGAGLPQRLIDRVQACFGESMSGTGFGLTETNGVGTAISGAWFMARPRSSGLRSPLMEIQIRDEEGRDLPAGTPGEVWLRGVTLMQGYWRQPEATAQALVDGAFRTGDVGYLDDAGFLYIVDRIKDVINRSGEKIAAAEIESCLSECGSIQESAVVAVPDARTGEAVVAIVVPREGCTLDEEQVKAHVASRLAPYKVPAKVIVRPQALPRNPTGKLVKRRLREEYALL